MRESSRESATAPPRHRSVDMSSRELRGLGTGGVGGRLGASVQEDQSQDNAWRIFQPLLGQPSPRRPVVARDVVECRPASCKLRRIHLSGH
jgi:hypothetical protein